MAAVGSVRSTTTIILLTGLVSLCLMAGSSSSVLADNVSPDKGGGSGTFSLTGSMNTARALHTSTLLNTGEVLVAGGIFDTNTGESLASAELFNPAKEADGESLGVCP
jgi:hypothetical protein